MAPMELLNWDSSLVTLAQLFSVVLCDTALNYVITRVHSASPLSCQLPEAQPPALAHYRAQRLADARQRGALTPGWVGGWMDGWTDGRTDGEMDR